MPPSAGPRRPLTEALAGLIFNPSCLPHGGHWPQQLTLAPLPRDMPQALGGTATGHPFLERAGGGTGAPAAPGVAGGSCPSWDTGSLGVLGDGTTWVRSRSVALAFAAGGATVPTVPPAPLQTAAAAARECPGRRDPGLKANRRRAGGWEKGRKPLSLCPLPPRCGGTRGECGMETREGWRGSPHPAARRQSETPSQTSPFWGLSCCSPGAEGHHGRPGALCTGRRASGSEGSLPRGWGPGGLLGEQAWAQHAYVPGGRRATRTLELQRSHLRGPWQALGFFFFFEPGIRLEFRRPRGPK